jgi:hypothetical protein
MRPIAEWGPVLLDQLLDGALHFWGPILVFYGAHLIYYVRKLRASIARSEERMRLEQSIARLGKEWQAILSGNRVNTP